MPIFRERIQSRADSILEYAARLKEEEEISQSDDSSSTSRYLDDPPDVRRRASRGEPQTLSLISRVQRMTIEMADSDRALMQIDEGIKKNVDIIKNFDNTELYLVNAANSKKLIRVGSPVSVVNYNGGLLLTPVKSGMLIKPPKPLEITEESDEEIQIVESESKSKLIDPKPQQRSILKKSQSRSKSTLKSRQEKSEKRTSSTSTTLNKNSAVKISRKTKNAQPSTSDIREKKVTENRSDRAKTVSFIEKNKFNFKKPSTSTAEQRQASSKSIMPTVMVKFDKK